MILTLQMFKSMPKEDQAVWVQREKPHLNSDQVEVVLAILNKENIVVLGGPGTGKTESINAGFELLSRLDPSIRCARTAPTAAAASLLPGGQTHYAWLQTGSISVQSHTPKFRKTLDTERCKKQLLDTDVWHLDEASLLNEPCYMSIESAARYHRPGREFMGGMQVVLSGDIAQLPVIEPPSGAGYGRDTKIKIRSILENLPPSIRVIMLTKNMRSAGDIRHQAIIKASVQENPDVRKKAVELLNQICCNKVLSSKEALSTSRTTGETIITCTNIRRDDYNLENNLILKNEFPDGPIPISDAKPLHTWDSLPPDVKKELRDKGGLEKEEDAITKQNRFEKHLVLYPGQNVRIRKNTDTHLNGDVCKFMSVSEDRSFITLFRYSDGATLNVMKCDLTSEFIQTIGYEQFPVIKDAASTVHMSQGMTIKNGIIFDPRGLEYFGSVVAQMLYVCISRTQSLDDIILTSPIDPSCITKVPCSNAIQKFWSFDFMEKYPKITMDELLAAFA